MLSTQIRLVNKKGVDVVPGEVGEILICSPYVARGYWKDDVLTSAKFLGKLVK